MNFLKAMFGNYSKREVKRVQPICDKVLALEDKYAAMSESELKNQTTIFKERLANGETTDDATKLYVIGEFDKVLSLDLTKVPESNKADADDDFAKEVEELIAQRTKARAEKDWATADAIRDKLKEMKVVVKDTKDGIEWHVEG